MNSDSSACECTAGFYDSHAGTAYDELACEALGEGCAAGDATSACASCAEANAAVHASGQACECAEGYYDTDASVAYGGQTCEALGEGCDTRTAANACGSCVDGTTSELDAETSARCVCRDGFYDEDFYGAEHNGLSCAALGEGCASGFLSDPCTTCYDGDHARIAVGGQACECAPGYFDTDAASARAASCVAALSSLLASNPCLRAATKLRCARPRHCVASRRANAAPHSCLRALRLTCGAFPPSVRSSPPCVLT